MTLWPDGRAPTGRSVPAPPGRHGPAAAPGERGAVTAEFAVALPAVLLVLGLLLTGAAAGLTQLRLEEAARAGARALARGEDQASVSAVVRQVAGDSASAAVASDGGWLSVTVTGPVGGAAGRLVPWPLTARASARQETGDDAALSTPTAGHPPGTAISPTAPWPLTAARPARSDLRGRWVS